jgi:hypothetical protein
MAGFFHLVGPPPPPPPHHQILAICRRGRGNLRVPLRGISTPGVLNLALRVLNLVIGVLNLVPGTQYPVLYRENPIENFPRQKSHPPQKPPPILGSRRTRTH